MTKKMSLYPYLLVFIGSVLLLCFASYYSTSHKKPSKASPIAQSTITTGTAPILMDSSGILEMHVIFEKDGAPVARCNQFGSKCEFVNGASLDDVVASWKETALANEESNTRMFHGWISCEHQLKQRLGHDDYIVTQEAKDWMGTLHYIRVCDNNGSSQLCGSLK